MHNIELSGDPWHLSRDGEGYTTRDGQYQVRRKGMAWTVWQKSDGENWRSVKTLSSLPKVREWLQTRYGS